MPGKSKKVGSYQPQLEELIPLAKAVELSGLSPSLWRYLVSHKKVWGRKLGRNWFTTEQAVREYLARPRRPGPKPGKKDA